MVLFLTVERLMKSLEQVSPGEGAESNKNGSRTLITTLITSLRISGTAQVLRFYVCRRCHVSLGCGSWAWSCAKKVLISVHVHFNDYISLNFCSGQAGCFKVLKRTAGVIFISKDFAQRVLLQAFLWQLVVIHRLYTRGEERGPNLWVLMEWWYTEMFSSNPLGWFCDADETGCHQWANFLTIPFLFFFHNLISVAKI